MKVAIIITSIVLALGLGVAGYMFMNNKTKPVRSENIPYTVYSYYVIAVDRARDLAVSKPTVEAVLKERGYTDKQVAAAVKAYPTIKSKEQVLYWRLDPSRVGSLLQEDKFNVPNVIRKLDVRGSLPTAVLASKTISEQWLVENGEDTTLEVQRSAHELNVVEATKWLAD